MLCCAGCLLFEQTCQLLKLNAKKTLDHVPGFFKGVQATVFLRDNFVLCVSDCTRCTYTACPDAMHSFLTCTAVA